MGGLPVVRTYSMNSWINGESYDPAGHSSYLTPELDSTLTYVFFRKENQFRQPSKTWMLVEESGDTINDSMFALDMGDANGIADCPATLHGSVYNPSFADGHVQAIKWQEASSDWNGGGPGPDVDWVNLKSMTTVTR
jgi:prepilin-type processing-associated H-X9-DG protein